MPQEEKNIFLGHHFLCENMNGENSCIEKSL